MNDFVKPTIEYGQLWPMLVVFGVACAGVLVEAFLPRERRYVVQTLLTLVGLVVALVGTCLVAADLPSVADGLAHGTIAAEGTIAVDGPAVFLWGLILLFGIAGVLLFAERRLEGGVTAFAGQAAALPGTEAERQASTSGLEHTEVYPLMMFAVGGMMLFPAANDLLTLFVALEVFSLPLYLLCGLARRRRLLSQEAALKYFLLGAFSSGFFLYGIALVYGFAGSMEFAAINEAVRNEIGNQTLLLIGMGDDGRRPVLQGRCGAVPELDARRLPGRAHPGHRVDGRGHQGRGVRRRAAALPRRLRRRPAGAGSR